jgi:acyl-homoserine lactone acylase PvdQ
MNVLYADRQGNTMFVYNGAVPRRDPQFDWTKPVPGGDPRTEWRELHTLDELPVVLNPSSHYLQNCNSTPFTTTSADNPQPEQFPSYMIEERDDDKRRAKRSREILEAMHSATFEDVERAAFDTELYWARHELPGYAKELAALQASDPALAAKVRKHLDHLLAWDGRISNGSTQATLCTAWYEELYGSGYPGEELKPLYVNSVPARFRALVRAANRLEALYGSWQTPWGEIHRIQRQPQAADLLAVTFSDVEPSLPCLGGHGPMGAIFTQYYTPLNRLPWWLTLRKRYGLLGTSYLAVYEFGPKVRGASLVPFGASGHPDSPHYFDQAPLLSERRLKPELFDWDDVRAAAREKYRPGER